MGLKLVGWRSAFFSASLQILVLLLLFPNLKVVRGWTHDDHDGYEDHGGHDDHENHYCDPENAKEYTLRITLSKTAPNGVEKTTILTNGQSPGPLITCVFGEWIRIRVENAIDPSYNYSGLAIHWHGLLQNGTQFMDGADFVTQCLIPSWKYYVYSFCCLQAPGTYWWHDHASTGVSDGLCGPFIIENLKRENQKSSTWPTWGDYHNQKRQKRMTVVESEEPEDDGETADENPDATSVDRSYQHNPGSDWSGEDNGLPEYDCEIIVFLSDGYYHKGSDIVAAADAGNFPAENADFIMVSGRSMTDCSVPEKQNLTCSPKKQCIPRFRVSRGQVCRIRVICGLTASFVNFTIDSHPMKLYSLDANDVVLNKDMGGPEEFDVLTCGPAQRFDVLVKMDKATEGKFWMNATIAGNLPGQQNVTNPKFVPFKNGAHAVLEYMKKENIKQEWTQDYQYRPCDHSDEIADWPKWKPGQAATPPRLLVDQHYSWRGGHSPIDKICKLIILNIVLEVTPTGLKFVFNGHQYISPNVPILVQVVLGEEITYQVNPYLFDLFDCIDMILNNGPAPHPLHLHGQSFWVLHQGAPNEGSWPGLGFVPNYNGPLRDTSVVNSNSWTWFRFIAANPGAWLFHCHIQWHAIGGLTSTIIVGQEEMEKHTPIPDITRKLCRYSGVEF